MPRASQLVLSRNTLHASKMQMLPTSGTSNTGDGGCAHLDQELEADAPPQALDGISTGPHQWQLPRPDLSPSNMTFFRSQRLLIPRRQLTRMG